MKHTTTYCGTSVRHLIEIMEPQRTASSKVVENLDYVHYTICYRPHEITFFHVSNTSICNHSLMGK